MPVTRRGEQPELNADDGGPTFSPTPTPTIASRLWDLAVREGAAEAPAAHLPCRSDALVRFDLDRWQDDGGRG
jgi:hypothetical protein